MEKIKFITDSAFNIYYDINCLLEAYIYLPRTLSEEGWITLIDLWLRDVEFFNDIENNIPFYEKAFDGKISLSLQK